MNVVRPDRTEEVDSEHLRDRVARRIVSNRYPLAAALALFAFLFLAGRISGAVFAGCAAAMIAISLFAPVRTPGQRRLEERGNAANGSENLRTQAVLDSIPDPVVVLGTDGAIRAVNRACDDVFADTVRAGMSALIRFRNPELLALVNQALAGGDPAPVELVERRPIDRWFKASIRRLPENGAGETQFILHFRDMSETRRIDRMRTDFIANASHELRTPLASLAGFIETLRGAARDDAAARETFLGIMQEQADRMSRLIDDLLSLSRLEMALGPGGQTPVDVADVLDHVKTAMEPAAAEAKVELVTDVGALEGGDCRVRGSRDELIQVFTNLVENAIRYGAVGGKVELIGDRAKVSGVDSAVITVRDYGPGIPADHIPRLTERFYRVDVESSRAKKGTGLGLAIVKHILTRHRGELSIRSKVGDGASFVVTIPLLPGENVDGTLA